MLLVETTKDRIIEILGSARPISLVTAASKEHAKEIAIAGRDAGFGIGVIEDRPGQLLVLVVGDAGRIEELRRFAGRYGAEMATDRHVDVEKVYVPASWLTGSAASHGVDVGEHL